ncbi:MAG: CRTAC1 family protein [Opitutaceae bacterium]|nr:CRTAC1 family protein [Verrucomicrobiales bacterium]
MNPPIAPSLLGPRDQTTLLGWTPKPGQRELLVATSAWPDGDTKSPAVFALALQNGGWTARQFLTMTDAVGPMALGDVDGDGHLDLFVGGRAVTGRYPQLASSALFINKAGTLERSASADPTLKNVGLVNGGVFTDLNGDGRPDLVLACEWGPVRVFLNNGGVLTEATQSLGLDKLTGWWTSIAAGDIDGDGRMDLVAGNWGLNTPYTASASAPARLFHGDFSGQGGMDMIEAYDSSDLGKIAPFRNLSFMSVGLPVLRARVASHWAYAASSVADLLGDKFATAQQLQATTLATTLLLNRGTRFEVVALPPEAQFAPVFGVCIADFDGEGHADVFLAQNFSATRGLEATYNAGRGLLLLGGSNGVLRTVRGDASGIRIYGDQRGAATGDFDGDGRIDLVVSQNGNATKLLQNQQGKPGLRIRLEGTAGNPTAVGAQLGWQNRALHEIQAGSGYWSQNSAVQVIARSSGDTPLVVRWPGGKTTMSPVPPNAREITIDIEGKVTAKP